MLAVEVCFATPERQLLIPLRVPVGTTILEAVKMALPDSDLSQQPVGIFGKRKTPDTLLRQHDRIEIYRPLVADPKESRRRRASR
ncbi:MAG: RnfH family protein [Pseudomonadota bacterium]|nr:RnfH family protein [Pseudomonadota bacterium]